MGECSSCGQGTLESELVETWMCRDGQWILFRNVPALVCGTCGEKYFAGEIVQRLEVLTALQNREIATGFLLAKVCDLAMSDSSQQEQAASRDLGTTAGQGVFQFRQVNPEQTMSSWVGVDPSVSPTSPTPFVSGMDFAIPALGQADNRVPVTPGGSSV